MLGPRRCRRCRSGVARRLRTTRTNQEQGRKKKKKIARRRLSERSASLTVMLRAKRSVMVRSNPLVASGVVLPVSPPRRTPRVVTDGDLASVLAPENDLPALLRNACTPQEWRELVPPVQRALPIPPMKKGRPVLPEHSRVKSTSVTVTGLEISQRQRVRAGNQARQFATASRGRSNRADCND